MMDTMFASLPESSVTGFEDLRMDSKGRPAEAVCRPKLTNRDVEAEVLARLARRGYDWTGKPRKQPGAS